MDNIADPDITFDENGVCNYYYQYLEAEKLFVKKGEEGAKEIELIVKRIKQDGFGKKYDCILGVSGGVDSSYLALLAKQYGLRVLCIHVDNGWNSELAVQNIENVIKQCGFDLFTYVINWEEFRDIQLSYFKANVIDIEAVTDVAIFSVLDQICKKQKVRYILDGRNVATEYTLPRSWVFKDSVNLINIHRKFGSKKLKTYPRLSKVQRFMYQYLPSFQSVQLLNCTDYNKAKVKTLLTEQLQWKDYGDKHCESVFTRFYQGYILPKKFGIDKRKPHLSNLIFSKQLTKEKALSELMKPIYDPELLRNDMSFVTKKLGLADDDFNQYLNSSAIPHRNYGYIRPFVQQYPVLKLLRPIKNVFTVATKIQ